MMMYEELVKNLRICSRCDFGQDCNSCTQKSDDVFCCDKLLHQAADAIEELQAQLMYSNDAAKAIAEKVPKWIPVNDRLPREDEDVLALSDKQRIYVGRFTRYKYRTPEIEFLIKSEMWNNFYVGKGISITHWMPLPEPPKEE